MTAAAYRAKFVAIAGLVNADTGSGGLKDIAGLAYIREFLHMDDANARQVADGAAPGILYEDATETDEKPTGGQEFEVGLINLHVYINRDNDRDDQRMPAVMYRLRQVLAGVEPADAAPWRFNKIRWRRSFKAPATDTHKHRVAQLYVGATDGN